MASLTVKQFDTDPALSATLSDVNGPIVLTNASSVKFVMKGKSSATVVTGTCTIVDAVSGKVSYAWVAPDTNTPDTYSVEFVIHWTAGGVQTVPNALAANPIVEIDANVTGAAE